MTFEKTITKTVHEILENKEKREIVEQGIVSLFKNPTTRKIMEQIIINAVLKGV